MLKYKIYVFFLTIISICTITFLTVKADNLPLKDKIIYLDAGHPSYLFPNVKV